MYFHGGMNETILFEFWKISDEGGLIASMIGIFLLAFFYEALKFYREHLYRHSFKTVEVNTLSVPVENGGAVKETHKTVQYVQQYSLLISFSILLLLAWFIYYCFHSFLNLFHLPT